MTRITLAMRIALIGVIGVLALWIAALALYYKSALTDNEAAHPAPARVLALAELLEDASVGQRAHVLDVANTAEFKVQIEGASALEINSARPTNDLDLQSRYEAAMGGRALVIARVSRSPGTPHFPRFGTNPRNALDIRVALKTGDVLVIDTRSPVITSFLGLPMGFGAGLLGTFVAFFALLIMQRETRPLAQLAKAVDRLDLSGHPIAMPNVRGRAPEIRAVVTAFDRLQGRLAELLKGRMVLIGGIAHDVRTFATRLRLRVDAIPDPDERGRATDDIADMVRLLDDALLASRVGARELSQELIDLHGLVRSEVETRRERHESVDLEQGNPPDAVDVLGDRLALRRVVANLVDNALKYGGAAHLRVTRDADMVELAVGDDGPGIPEAQSGAMFEPFTRLDASRNRKTGGAGLGLAIARGIIEAHGGSISFETASDGGCVSVRLPLFQKHPP